MKKNYWYRKLKHQRRRSKREMYKRSPQFKKRRRLRLANRLQCIYQERAIEKKEYILAKAPDNFSFIENTDEMLRYVIHCKELLHSEYKVECDISNISYLSSDAIALLAACTNDKLFLGPKGKIKGNAPLKPELQKIFVESGFYNHVNASRALKRAQRKESNLFHRESNVKVESDIAKKACMLSVKDSTHIDDTVSDLFEMLVEAMSNTNNHANNDDVSKKIKWWLYTYNAPDGTTAYTFIDLGVGIFDSVPATKYKRFKRYIGIDHNIDIVPDLLAGKIKSREEVDNDIRGKGIPQIAENSQNSNFTRAFIISNNVKIDLKTKTAEKLSENFLGTLLFWEIRRNP